MPFRSAPSPVVMIRFVTQSLLSNVHNLVITYLSCNYVSVFALYGRIITTTCSSATVCFVEFLPPESQGRNVVPFGARLFSKSIIIVRTFVYGTETFRLTTTSQVRVHFVVSHATATIFVHNAFRHESRRRDILPIVNWARATWAQFADWYTVMVMMLSLWF